MIRSPLVNFLKSLRLDCSVCFNREAAATDGERMAERMPRTCDPGQRSNQPKRSKYLDAMAEPNSY